MAKLILAILSVVVLLGTVWFVFHGRQAASVCVPPGASPGLAVRTSGTYKTKTATYRSDEAVLVVHENRDDPGSRLIALPVKRIRSNAERAAEPIFYLAGGPGGSNMGFRPPEDLLARHDVVLVGYRGVDGSVRLDCPEMKTAVLGDGQDITSPASLQGIAEAMRTCAQRLKDDGVDLRGYTIPEVVEDMEDARKALGYERVHILSESYGTRVAQIWARMHRESLSRSAMISVNPPGHFVWEPATIERQLRDYSELCAKDEACRARTTSLTDSMRRVSHAMPRRWLFLDIDPGKVRLVTHTLLFHRKTAAVAFDAWLAADRGDPSGLALMSLAYDLIIPGVTVWGDLLAKGSSADFDAQRDYEDLRAPETILGAAMSLVIWQPASKGWPVFAMPEELRHIEPTDVETLLVNGSVDFSTPVEGPRDELLPSLSRGRLVVLSQMGHVGDFWGVNRPAAERLLVSFFETGNADASGFSEVPMDFRVTLGLPGIAKILLATGLLALLAALLAARRVIRRWRSSGAGGSSTTE